MNILLERLLLEPNPPRINSIMLHPLYLQTRSLNTPLYTWFIFLRYKYFSFSDYSLTPPKHSLLYYPISMPCAVQLTHFQISSILVQVLFLHRCFFSPAAADLHTYSRMFHHTAKPDILNIHTVATKVILWLLRCDTGFFRICPWGS